MIEFITKNLKDILIICLLAFVGWTQFSSSVPSDQLHGTDAHQIASGVAQGKTQVVSSIDVETLNRAISESVKGQVKKAKADIISTVEGKWSSRNNEHSKNADKYNVKKKQLKWVDQSTGKEMPIGVALYSPKKDEEGKDPWIAKAYNLEFHTQILRTIDRTGGVHNTVALSAQPKNLKGYTGKEFPLTVDLDNTSFQEVQNKKYEWSLWNPTLSLGGSFNILDSGGLLKFNVINYGYKDSLPVWQFLSPTLIIGKNVTVGVEAASYNIGEVLPIIKDLHIGLGIDSNKQIFLGVSSVL